MKRLLLGLATIILCASIPGAVIVGNPYITHAGGDPYFSNRLFLAHADGADASTTITDSSSFARTVTALGNAQIDTAQSQWGGSALLLDGTGDGFSLADANEFDFGTGDWTIELWIRWNTIQTKALCDHGFTAAGGIIIQSGSTGLFSIITSNVTRLTESSSLPSTGVWYFYQFTMDAGTLKIYRDGVAAGSVAHSVSLTSTEPFYFGVRSAGTLGFNGWFDDIRISNRAAVPGVPTAAFPNN